MPELTPGLYEALVTDDLLLALACVEDRFVIRRELTPDEAPRRLAGLLAGLVDSSLGSLPEDERVEQGISVARDLLQRLAVLTTREPTSLPSFPGSILESILREDLLGAPATLIAPLTPLRETALLTNSPGEPNLWSQLLSEIDSADEIDVVIAFIRRSGITPLIAALTRHCQKGLPLRVLTTTYTGSTEQAALELLVDLGAEVRVSYDVASTRLHAKAWMFQRNQGVSTTYIGSSNLTYSAQVTGLEWNLRVSSAPNPDVISKFSAVFDSYWEDPSFVPFDPAQFAAALETDRKRDELILLPGIELRLQPFQERLLELIELSRSNGHHRNLLVSATGTGKTVVAAVDYSRLMSRLGRSRLLFVAHREEILNQSIATFRYALRDFSFGERWVGGEHPKAFDHVFASIQSLNAAELGNIPPDHFDVVIVDEFHHAAARSYRRLLGHVQPIELLGLTATPERTDGLPILHWFDNRIAAELRLWDAIDQGRLTPFMYYGIHDGLDLKSIPWRRGSGYDVDELSSLYTSTDAWARLVVQEVSTHVDDVGTMRCLGFCVSVAHARFMAHHFSTSGLPSVALDGTSPDSERIEALAALRDGTIRAIFSVDLFNEGLDMPALDTVLMLRPTDSPTLFLQQLGRGLRQAPGKSSCIVLDFVGLHRREFRFDRKFRALLGGSRKSLEKAVLQGFPYLPAGCLVQLDEKAAAIVLENIRQSIPSRWRQKVEELRALAAEAPEVSLAEYLSSTGLDIEDVYMQGHSWSELRSAAGVSIRGSGPHETQFRRAVGRLLHVNDSERTHELSDLLKLETPPLVDQLPERQRRLLRMFVAVIAGQVLTKADGLQESVDLVWSHSQVRSEVVELFGLLEARVDHLVFPLSSHADVPLNVHARYTRLEILAAFDVGQGAKSFPMRPGVFHVADAHTDLLLFTLDKSSESFSPTTRYRDYAISQSLIHWESQSTTRENGETGLRYRNHVALQHSILMFARLNTSDRSFWFLGPATYRQHVGDRPMAVTWELLHPLPGDLYAAFAAAAA